MAVLNHINLAVSNVPELTRFFVEAFDFRLEDTRGQDKFAVLVGSSAPGKQDFALILMHDHRVTDATYPALFHIGFLMNTREEVDRYYQRIAAAGFEAPAPALLVRGGPKTYGLYARPFGIMVEVSCPAE